MFEILKNQVAPVPRMLQPYLIENTEVKKIWQNKKRNFCQEMVWELHEVTFINPYPTQLQIRKKKYSVYIPAHMNRIR